MQCSRQASKQRSQASLATLSCYPDGLAHIIIVLITLITLTEARESVLNDLQHTLRYIMGLQHQGNRCTWPLIAICAL